MFVTSLHETVRYRKNKSKKILFPSKLCLGFNSPFKEERTEAEAVTPPMYGLFSAQIIQERKSLKSKCCG